MSWGADRDVLDSLLPEAQPELAQKARRVATFLRLLSTESRARPADSVGLSVARARRELEGTLRTSAAEVLVDLARHHLRGALGPDSFLTVPAPRLTLERAWARRAELERAGLRLPAVTAPGEPSASVARRMLEGLRSAEGRSARAAWLDAALVRCDDGPRPSSRCFEALERDPRTPPTRRAETRLARIELALDAGRVGEAAGLLKGVRGADATPALAARFRRLFDWVALLGGESALARPSSRDADERMADAVGDQGLPGHGAPERLGQHCLPTPLIELRERVPSWRNRLLGPPRGASAAAGGFEPPAPIPQDASEWNALREALGATVLALYRTGGRAGDLLLAWSARDERCANGRSAKPGTALVVAQRPERELMAAGQPRLLHRTLDVQPPVPGPLPGALAPDTLAAAAWPLPAGRTDPAWVWLEFDHHLLPTAERLQGLAHRATPWSALQVPESDESSARARCLRELASEARLEGPGRRWWGLVRDGAGWRELASDGTLDDRFARPWSRFDLLRQAAGLGRFRASAVPEGVAPFRSGVVFPLAPGTTAGALVVASRQLRDFDPSCARARARMARIEACLADAGARLELADFLDGPAATGLGDLYFDPNRPTTASLIAAIRSAAAHEAATLVTGQPGTGKRAVARWVLHGRGACSRPRVLAGSREVTWARLARAQRAAHEGAPVVVEGIESLRPRHRARLLASEAPLVLTWTRDAPAADGEVRVPALEERRAEVPELARRLLELAIRSGTWAPAGPAAWPVPKLEPEAEAWLWRRSWPGNLSELQRLCRGCIERLEPGTTTISAADLASTERALGLPRFEPPRPRDVDEALVRCALDCSRGRGGRVNRRVAARLLGWHPDTLRRKLTGFRVGTPKRQS